MNPVGLYFASGDSFYAGAVLLVLATILSPCLQSRSLLLLRNLAAWFALAMIVMACPPFSWIVDGMFVIAFGLWFAAVNRTVPGLIWSRLRFSAAAALVILLLVLSTVELSHRKIPVIAGEPSDHLVVIGDSISSSIDLRAVAWPVVLQQMTGVPVKNLARPGAQVVEAQAMAEKVTSEDRVLLVEIGGNDLLAGVPSSEFEKSLDELLSRLASPGRVVVMFELPLLPNKIGYGRVQRRLASKYGVPLIPKRYFVEVIGGANATSDGLHLSNTGARRMAELVAQVFSPVLKPPSGPVSPLP